MDSLPLEKVKEVLSPKLGEFVAGSTIRVNCERMGIGSKEVTKSQLLELAKKLRITLILFLNERETEKMVQEITNLL